jgi:hypothetical protein
LEVPLQLPAFIVISLDSDKFNREWLRRATSYVLDRHSALVFVLADRLLAYNKFVSQNEREEDALTLTDSHLRIEQRKNDVSRMLHSEIVRLPPSECSRVSVSTWDSYADASFVNIERILKIAYSVLTEFKRCVDEDVQNHFSVQRNHYHTDAVARDLSAQYVVEETAMAVRIAEAGIPFEYYPQAHIKTLTFLYEDRFAQSGLSVETLVGHPKTRIFQALPLDNFQIVDMGLPG